MKKQNNYHRRNKKIVLLKLFSRWKPIFWFCVVCLVFTVSAIFGPALYAQNYAEQGLKKYNKELSGLKSQGKWQDIWTPEYVFVTENTEKKQVRIDFIELYRQNLFFWQKNDNKSTYAILLDTSIDKVNKELLDKFLGPNKESKNKSDGKVSTSSAAVQTSSINNDDSVIQTLADPNNNRQIKLVTVNNKNENQVWIGGQANNSLKNVANLEIDPSGRFLYYERFVISKEASSDKDTVVRYEGKIYQWDLEKSREMLIYDFGQSVYINFKANNQEIAYALANGEIGVIDITEKIKSKANNFQIAEAENYLNTEQSFLPVSVIDISSKTALFQHNNVNGFASKYFQMELDRLDISY
jgi:hypothetical protein